MKTWKKHSINNNNSCSSIIKIAKYYYYNSINTIEIISQQFGNGFGSIKTNNFIRAALDGFENLDASSSYPFDLDHFDPFEEPQIFSNKPSPVFVCDARNIPADVWLHICSFLPVRVLYVLVTSSKFFFRVLIAYRSQFNASSDIVSRYSRMGYNYLLEKFLFDAFRDYGVVITDKSRQQFPQPMPYLQTHEKSNDTATRVRKRFFNRRTELLQDLRQRNLLAVCWGQLDIEHADMVAKPRYLSLMDMRISGNNVSILMSRRNLAEMVDDEVNTYGFTEDIYDHPPQNSWTLFMNHVFSPELRSLSINDCHFSLDIRFDWDQLNLYQHCPNLTKIEIKLYEKYCDWICESLITLPNIANLVLLPHSEITKVFYDAVMTRLYSGQTKKENHLAKLKQLHILESLKFTEPLTFLTDCSNTLQSLTITIRSNDDIQYFPSSLKELSICFERASNTIPPKIKLKHLEKLAITGAKANREQIDNLLRACASTLKHLTIDPDIGIEYPIPKELPSLKNVHSCFIHSFSRPTTSEDLTYITSFLKNNFRTLNLSGFSVNYTKSIISALPKTLTELYLEGTISQLPTHIKLQKFSFTINGHQPAIVHAIDTSFWKDSLKELVVNGNPQPNGSLTDNISKLKILEKLVLISIGFETIPASIYKLKNLKHLDLSQNNLKKISKHIAYMENLEFLDISKNKITKMDMTVLKLMKKLERVEFDSNPFIPTYESTLTFKNWLYYPTFNTITTACKNRFLEKKSHKQLYNITLIRITWFVELYKHVRFVINFEYFNNKRQKTERKSFRGAMDKVYCQIYEWDLIQP
ncbi:hypothetical protein C9374_006289 [Naegleria lovaniensis]|uniref:F-box domain-containing protein n=1 Tax=Naegleria lovaniensis TaxID=51637 RepID=A0AA88GNQ9_NAELO|nr:uncharacterized protein C9374_006289 [Naegleria lovaniensis]KAG2381300.1 hypothetical protein C9374_006289 [Naegleria lovaniensis]